MATLSERVKQAVREGYGLSENIYARGLYLIHKPNGDHYTVDLDGAEPACNCQATKTCKHIGLALACRRFWLALARNAAAQPRRRFSAKHIEALRNLAPTMVGPKVEAPAKPALCAERIAQIERIEARIARDFGHLG